MDRNEACRVAQAYLDGDPGNPAQGMYQVGPPADAFDVGWAWVVPWNTTRYYETGHTRDSQGPGSGPLVVVKDTRDAWMMGSAPPLDGWLKNYAAEHGYQHTISYDPPRPDMTKLAIERMARMPSMSRAEAVSIAQAHLDDTSPPGRPQKVGDPAHAVDVGFAWVLPWNSARYYQTGNPVDADKSATGPLILTKDTQDLSELDSYEDIDNQVTRYAEMCGYLHTEPYHRPAS